MAETWNVSNAEYHADTTKIGSSMLKTALESPHLYRRRFVDDPPLTGKRSESMALGSALHCLVLEPDKFPSLFVVKPEVDGRTREGRAANADFALNAIGKDLLSADQYEKAKRMANAVLAEPLVQELMDGAIVERGIVWEEGGLVLKCKPDIFVPGYADEEDLHLDIKSSSDPSPENWKSLSDFSPIFKYRYDMQVAAHYTAGIEALTGRPCLSGVIVVGSEEPHDVYIYPMTTYRECGEAWRQKALSIIRHCRETGVWRRPEQDFVSDMPAPGQWNFPQ